jgi:aminoglycoside phosphotransferase (APT) family kinase protein
MCTPTVKSVDEGTLLGCLESTFPELFGSPSAVAGVSRSRSDLSTSYDTYIITLRLTAGEELKIFLKDFGFSQLPKEGVEQRRERELRVYRDLLAGANLGTARYYGSVWDRSGGRFWLLLEFVPGTEVCDCDFEYWVAAAGWLGRMHAHFARRADLLSTCDFLPRHDARFFHSVAAGALRSAARCSPDLSDRLVRVLRGYGKVVETMVAQPPTLVHGTYRPGQVLVDARRQPWRVCPVDWEMAALGSGYYDLAYIADGFEPPRLDEMVGAYRREVMGAGMTVPSHDRVKAVVACYRLHRALNWLNKAGGLPGREETVSRLTGMAEQLAGGVL